MVKPNNDQSTGIFQKMKDFFAFLFRKLNKIFDRIVFTKVGSLILSLLISLVVCFTVDYQDIRYELFDDTSTVVNLGNVNVNILADQDDYEISGIPSSVQVSLTGNATTIQVFRQQNTNMTVTADLRPYNEEGSYIIDLTLDNLPSNITATLTPETVTATVTAKENRTFNISPEILIGSGQVMSDYETPTLSSSTVTIRATDNELNSIRFVRAIVDVSGFTSGDEYTVDATIVAYDADGNRVQVDMDPASVQATVKRVDSE